MGKHQLFQQVVTSLQVTSCNFMKWTSLLELVDLELVDTLQQAGEIDNFDKPVVFLAV